MPAFRYEIKQASGQVQSGVLNAPGMTAAAEMLRSQNAYILALAPLEVSKSQTNLLSMLNNKFSTGPGLKEVANFSNQLSVMIKAGISIRAALEGISEQTEHPKFKEMLIQMKKDVEGGKSFSDALAKHKVFSSLYINMVKASELSGSFAQMLERLVDYLNQQIETRSMVTGAMIYPGVIGTMAVCTTTFLLTFVVPRFVMVFKGHENMLPLPTKILLFLSHFVCTYWYFLLMGLGAAIWAFFTIIRTPGGRLWFDKMKLSVPIFKRMFRALYITRSLHTMGELVNAGVPMLDTLAITADISGNTLYRRMWRAVYASVKQGKKITTPLQKSTLLPRAVVQMISAGEESGKLGETLDSVAKFYSKELKATVKTCTSLIEPIMIICMGGIVGFIAMSIILPIFRMSQLVH